MKPYRKVQTFWNLYINRTKRDRKLEIGPGKKRIKGFETLNISYSPVTDYVWDASDKLPFKDESFCIIYASHILEHIPWYSVETTLFEWKRILKRGGWVEIWVPNGLKIAKAFVDAENGNNYISEDGWYKFNEERDPCKWASGRIFTYGDGKGSLSHPNWHRGIFSPRYLENLLNKIGFREVTFLNDEEVRGYDHGWINLGIKGKK